RNELERISSGAQYARRAHPWRQSALARCAGQPIVEADGVAAVEFGIALRNLLGVRCCQSIRGSCLTSWPSRGRRASSGRRGSRLPRELSLLRPLRLAPFKLRLHHLHQAFVACFELQKLNQLSIG